MFNNSFMRWLPVGVVVLVGILSIRLIGPSVPSEIYLLTGPERSAFHADGQRYKEYLERRGVAVHLVETGGAVDNLRALVARDRPQAGFVEAGTEIFAASATISRANASRSTQLARSSESWRVLGRTGASA